MPPMPTWDSLHPLVVHFPIALLLIVPVFILIAVVSRTGWKPMSLAALTLLVLGTAAAALAVATGEAGEAAAKAIPASKATLERHEELAELTRNVFIGLTLVFAAIVATAMLWKSRGRQVFIVASLVFLLPYAGGSLLLANTAHEGGVLVHGYGVHAPVAGGAPTPAISSVRERDEE